MSTQASPLQLIPLGLDDFVQGGLISDVPVEILAIQYRGWDYNQTRDSLVLAVWQQLAILDEHLKRGTDEPVEQYWSCGPDLTESGISITQDGYGAAPGPNKTALTLSSNFYLFLQSLTKPVLGGPPMPKDFLKAGSLKPLVGLKYHLVRQTQPKREGLAQSERRRKDFDPSVAVATRIYVAPWAPNQKATKAVRGVATEAAAAGATAPTTPAGTPAAAAPPVNGAPGVETQAAAPAAAVDSNAMDAITLQAQTTVRSVLQTTPMFGSVTELKIECFRYHAKTKADVRLEIVKLIESPGWLKANGFNITDDGIITA